jgi:hypothetical protein
MYVDTRAKIDFEAVIAFLNRHWKGSKSCNVCGNNNWNVNPDLA